MDKLVINNKIESLRQCLKRVELRCPESVDALLLDIDAQDVLTLNLSRAVQLCVDISVHIISELDQSIPDTMGLAFAKLFSEGIISKDLSDNLRNAVGFRNIAVHNYQDLDWDVVFGIAHEKLSDFKEFTRQIVNHLES